jgi:uncharacterized protein YqgV (UPF0045/DUF77 family)
MKIQAQVSIYPLKTKALAQPVEQFCRALQDPALTVTTQPMSTQIAGDADRVFQAVERAFQTLAAQYSVVMDLKVSNACPALAETER